MTSRVDRLENESKTYREALKQSDNSSFNFEGMCSEMMNELQQRERRKLNLIVFGAPDATSGTIAERKEADKEQCCEIFQTIGLPNCSIKDVARIGRPKEDKKRLLRVTLTAEGDKIFILNHSMKLRRIPQFRNIFVKSDRTDFQRKIDFELRKELDSMKATYPDKEFVIFKGKVIEKSLDQGFRRHF